MAESWFGASQKRIGTLLCRGGGVLEAQCFFYSGVYLMHTFRPFAAWGLFVQAVACCQTFECFSTETRELSQPVQSNTDDEAGWLSEESMYWTCFKSELYVMSLSLHPEIVSTKLTSYLSRELRLELSLPGCCSGDLSYPKFLPSPPFESLQEQEQAWFFYLAEISLRRVACQILAKILQYRNGKYFWKLADLAQWIPTFESQTQQWYLLMLVSLTEQLR